jgi:flagellar assembly protein FliH
MATIIRKDSPREAASGRAVQPVSFSFGDMRGQAENYLEIVRVEAAKIVQEAHQQAEQIRRQAEAAGRKAAEAAAERILEEKIAKRMTSLVPALEQLVAQINDAKGELLAQWEQAAIRVATAIAERIIHRELEREPQIKLELIGEALQLAAGNDEIRLYVNPNDYEHLGSEIQRLANTVCKLAPTDITADTAVSPGGCRVEMRYGEVDNRIESQLKRIEEDLA